MTIFALMAIFSIIGVQAEGKEAKIAETGTEYATFVEAVNAAESGQTVELLQNASFDGGLVITKNLTIDGKGFTLTDVGENGTYNNSIKITGGDVTIQNITIDRTNTKSFGIFILTGNNKLTLTLTGAVTVKNGSGNGAGVLAECNYGTLKITGNGVKFENCNGYYGAIALINNAKADIESVEIVSTVTPSIARNAIGIFNNCTLDIKSGKISGYKKASIGVGNYGTDRPTSNSSTVTVGDGVVIENGGIAGIELGAAGTVNTSASISGCTYPINISGAGTINVEGGEITGTQKVINATGGTVNVKAGTVTGTANVIAVEGGSVNITGGEINGNNDVVRVSKGTVNIMGGTVNVATSAAINATGGTVNISGGTVTGGTNLIYTNGAEATVNVTDGKIVSKSVSINADNGTVNISGGTINTNGSAIYMAGEATAVVEINGGTISGNNTAKGIHLEKGTVKMNNGAIKNFEYGIRVLGGTLNVSGGTIETCTYGIGAGKGTVSMTGGTITGCTTAGLFVNKTDTLSVKVSGGKMTGNDSGINLASGGNEVTLAGDTEVTGNKGSDIWIPADGTLSISGKFTGKVTASSLGSVEENIKAASDFEGLSDLSCITNRNDGSRFAYYNKTSNAFGWTKHPEVAITATDSGVYKNDKGATLGAIRFITEFQAVPTDAIEYIGTYVLNAETVNTSAIPEGTKFVKFESDELTNLSADSKNAYAVDVINIENINFGKPVIGISFVKLKGIDTPRYATAVVKNIDTNKYLGISDGTDFAAQE